MRAVRRHVTALVALACAAPTAVSAQQLEVTLQEAVRRALDVQPAMVQARGDVRNANAQLLSNSGSFLPSITAGISSNRKSGDRFNLQTNQIVRGGASTSYSGNLSLDLDLFDGFRRFANRRAANASQDAADAGVIDQRYQVTLLTKQAFYNALASDELVRVAEAQVKRAEQQLKITVDKLRAGSATRSDTLRSTVDLGNARLQLLQAQASLATAQANLGRQIGVDQPVRAVPDSALPALPDTAGLRAQVVAASPQVQRADAHAREAGAELAVSRSAYWPTLSLSYSNGAVGLDPPWTSTNSYINNWSLQFLVRWPLFNGFQREQQMVSSSVQRDIAVAQAADVRRAASAQFTQQLAALFTAYEQIGIAQTNLDAAREDLRVVSERYRVGAATILDVLTSEANLTQAEVNVVQARYNYLVARAQLEALLGHAL